MATGVAGLLDMGGGEIGREGIGGDVLGAVPGAGGGGGIVGRKGATGFAPRSVLIVRTGGVGVDGMGRGGGGMGTTAGGEIGFGATGEAAGEGVPLNGAGEGERFEILVSLT